MIFRNVNKKLIVHYSFGDSVSFNCCTNDESHRSKRGVEQNIPRFHSNYLSWMLKRNKELQWKIYFP